MMYRYNFSTKLHFNIMLQIFVCKQILEQNTHKNQNQSHGQTIMHSIMRNSYLVTTFNPKTTYIIIGKLRIHKEMFLGFILNLPY
jgi:hypothetical protein